MCGRYSFFIPIEEAERSLERKAIENPDWFPHYNAAPTQGLPVVTNEFPEIIQFYRWGLVPKWAKDPSIGHKMINTRAESIFEKPAFKNNFRYKRCLVLADGYYEWKVLPSKLVKGKPAKQPYRFQLPGNEILLIGGLWDTWGSEGLNTFSIITCPANHQVSPYHDRMPVILSHKEAEIWLNQKSTAEDLLPLLKPAPEGLLDIYPISTYLNKPGNEGKEVIERIEISQ